MTFTTVRFANFEAYLSADWVDLPEGRHEYWDGELVPVMTESLLNSVIANYLYFLLIQAGIDHELVHPGKMEVVVPGRPRTRFPDLTVLDEIHLVTLKKRSTIPSEGLPPRLVVEVVSPGDENSENYRRDYQEKRDQYADRGIPEYWLIDPDRAWVMVGTLISDHYQFNTFQAEAIVLSPSFPELTLTAVQILQAGKVKI